MPTLHLLGTGAAVSDPHRTTTMLAFEDGGNTVVVDCGGDVFQRLLEARVDPHDISALIVTHEHPDHVSGFPLFMEKIWLAGRRRPIPVHGIHSAISQARRLFETFDTSGWDGMPQVLWHEVELSEDADVLEDDHWRIVASPGRHGVPVVGLRVLARSTGHVTTYSCDTEPTDPILRLSKGVDTLVHEATGEGPGHTSHEQAAEIAASAGAGRLLLVHLPPDLTEADLTVARETFPDTHLGRELGRYDL